MKTLTIITGGDLGPTSTNYSIFADGNLSALIDSRLFSLINSADYRIFNLEVPLTDTETPIIKDGPNLAAPASSLNGIKMLRPAIFGLANNHIMDHDEQGLFRTMDLLNKAGLSWVGAGKNIEEAVKPFIVEKDGIKVGIYGCAENEFSIAGEKRAGANPFDPLESLDHITHLKNECDFVIVLHHGGKEQYRYPSPGLQKACRKMAEKGADLVICQHSHCIGAYENYSKSTIVYGQGNFLFDRRSNEFWDSSLLVKATFGEEMRVEFIPVSKNGNGVMLAEPDTSEQILREFHARSHNITQPGFVDSEFEKYCLSNGLFYLGSAAGLGKTSKKIDRMLKGLITGTIYSRDKLNMLQNFIECESHREIIVKYLDIKRKQ